MGAGRLQFGGKPTIMSKQSRAEQTKTISISEVRALHFKIVKPQKGIIEIVNCADQGRVCTLKTSDFKSKADAEIYAQLMVLAPMLLNEYVSKTKTLKEVIERLRKRIASMKVKAKKPR